MRNFALAEATVLLPLVDHYVLSSHSGFGLLGSLLNHKPFDVRRFQITAKLRGRRCFLNNSDPIEYFASKWSGV